METLVVGAGTVGRWFADLVGDDIAFIDTDREVAETAATAIHRQRGRTGRVVSEQTTDSFGLVCVAVPIPESIDAIERYGPRAQTGVVDVTGWMQQPLEAMAHVAPARERVSYHPLFSPDQGPGRVAVSKAATGPVTDRIERAFTDAGNEMVPVEAATHDDAMATIQGRAHAALLAFGLAAEDVPPELTTPVFEELDALRDRVTAGDARVYADIQSVFDGATDIAAAAERIADADREAFAALYDDASG